MHEMIQSYFDEIYSLFDSDIKQSLFSKSNEIYGELCYYSIVKLLKHLEITKEDHFLDIGSGLGKLVFQIFLTTNAASVTGIEINNQRHSIAYKVCDMMRQKFPEVFRENKDLNLIFGDFLKQDFNNISVIYVCSAVFSFELLDAMAKKINGMDSVKKIVSFRRLPGLDNFKLIKKIFLHGTWDNAACYIYFRKV